MVSKWKKLFLASDFCKNNTNNCTSQIKEAVSKGKQQSDENNIKAAVEMIHIYTSNNPPTYWKVNAILRDDPNKNVSVKDESMFREFANLLEISIDTLCRRFPKLCRKHSIVYRGQSYCVSIPFNRTTYTFKSFLSTSKLIQEAERFYNECSKSSVLFQMTAVKGIYIRDFSKFDYEEEVLIKPQSTFKILKNLNSTTNESHLKNITHKIQSIKGTEIPKAYIYATMSQTVTSGFKRSITTYPCENAVSSGPQYVGSATVMLVMCTICHILYFKTWV